MTLETKAIPILQIKKPSSKQQKDILRNLKIRIIIDMPEHFPVVIHLSNVIKEFADKKLSGKGISTNKLLSALQSTALPAVELQDIIETVCQDSICYSLTDRYVGEYFIILLEKINSP